MQLFRTTFVGWHWFKCVHGVGYARLMHPDINIRIPSTAQWSGYFYFTTLTNYHKMKNTYYRVNECSGKEVSIKIESAAWKRIWVGDCQKKLLPPPLMLRNIVENGWCQMRRSSRSWSVSTSTPCCIGRLSFLCFEARSRYRLWCGPGQRAIRPLAIMTFWEKFRWPLCGRPMMYECLLRRDYCPIIPNSH